MASICLVSSAALAAALSLKTTGPTSGWMTSLTNVRLVVPAATPSFSVLEVGERRGRGGRRVGDGRRAPGWPRSTASLKRRRLLALGRDRVLLEVEVEVLRPGLDRVVERRCAPTSTCVVVEAHLARRRRRRRPTSKPSPLSGRRRSRTGGNAGSPVATVSMPSSSVLPSAHVGRVGHGAGSRYVAGCRRMPSADALSAGGLGAVLAEATPTPAATLNRMARAAIGTDPRRRMVAEHYSVVRGPALDTETFVVS